MGRSILLKCNKCGKTLEFRTGQGIRDNDPDMVLSHFDSETQPKLQKILSDTDRVDWDFSIILSVCRRDNTVKAVPAVFLTEGGTDRIITSDCGCGGEHDFYDDEDLEDGTALIRCPECGADMEYFVNGFWD